MNELVLVENKKMPITIVANKLIPQLFPKVRPMLEKGKKYWEDYYRLHDIKRLLIKGDLQLWVGVEDKEIKLILLTTLAVYPRSVWLRLLYIGGERMRDALYYLPTVESWGKAHGAMGTETIARGGWLRLIKKTRLAKAEQHIFLKLKYEAK